jgi:hypothetical protein
MVAATNQDIWRVYKDLRPTYVGVMKEYNEFFAASIHAHFVAFVVAIYRLYESKPGKGKTGTFNIPGIIMILRDNGDLPNTVLDELDEMQNRVKPYWEKIKVLRNRVFGHRSTAHKNEELFKQVAMRPDECTDILELTKNLLNKLTYAWDRSTHPFDNDARKDMIRLMDDLAAVHSRSLEGGIP